MANMHEIEESACGGHVERFQHANVTHVHIRSHAGTKMAVQTEMSARICKEYTSHYLQTGSAASVSRMIMQ